MQVGCLHVMHQSYALYKPSDIMDIQPDTGCILGKSVNSLEAPIEAP